MCSLTSVENSTLSALWASLAKANWALTAKFHLVAATVGKIDPGIHSERPKCAWLILKPLVGVIQASYRQFLACWVPCRLLLRWSFAHTVLVVWGLSRGRKGLKPSEWLTEDSHWTKWTNDVGSVGEVWALLARLGTVHSLVRCPEADFFHLSQ